jgi:hypothetical protein
MGDLRWINEPLQERRRTMLLEEFPLSLGVARLWIR